MKVTELTKEAFSPWGKYISADEESGRDSTPEFDYVGNIAVSKLMGPVSMSILHPAKRDIIVNQFESHRLTPEICTALRNNCIIFAAGDVNGVPDIPNTQAFLLKEGDTIVYDPGTWHWVPYPVDTQTCTQLIIYKDQTGKNDFYLHKLEKPIVLQD